MIWKYPPLSTLSDRVGTPADRGDVKKTALIIERTLESFGISARVAEVNGGPTVTQYALEVASGTNIAKIFNLQQDIAMAVASKTGSIRVETPIPGRSLVGIEIPNYSNELVTFKSILGSEEMRKRKSKLAVGLGKDSASNPIIIDLDRAPYLLIAGTPGSGKSICVHSLIMSLIFRNSPDEVKLVLIDPSRVELTLYNGISHLLAPTITEPEKALSALKWTIAEMDKRYKLFQSVGVRNIQGYNEMSGFQGLPYIVIFIDDPGTLLQFAPDEINDTLTNLTQMGRAVGTHLVITTQRPSIDVIAGLIKAKIPCRISFLLPSVQDSMVILDQPGAEKLLGRGDMLVLPPDSSKPLRVQGALVMDSDIRALVDYFKNQGIEPEYTPETTEMPIGKVNRHTSDRDDLFEEAIRIVCQYDRASASLLNRRLSIGYTRAAEILDQLEEEGVVGAGDGAKPRKVLIENADEFLNSED